MRLVLFPTIFCLLALAAHALTVDEALKLPQRWNNKIFRNSVEPFWLEDGRFWYKIETGPESHEFVAVNPQTGETKRTVTFEELGFNSLQKMKASDSLEQPHPSKNGGPPARIAFYNKLRQPVRMVWVDSAGKQRAYGEVQPGGVFRQSTYAGHVWQILAPEGQPLAVITARPGEVHVEIDGPSAALTEEKQSSTSSRMLSPDGRWRAELRGGKLYLKNLQQPEASVLETRLPDAGKGTLFGGLRWSPDSSYLALSGCLPVTKRKITLVESSPKGQTQPRTRQIDYPKPGDELPKPWVVIAKISPHGLEARRVDPALYANPFIQRTQFELRWASDSREVYFEYNERGHQRYCILGVNAETGTVRKVVEEVSKTFIDHTRKIWRHWLEQTGEILWMSERDGWCHLWLYDVRSGTVKTQVTQGAWVVRGVEHVDEQQRKVWFMASGLRKEEDPYHQHLCSIDFDGKNFRQLTEADGQHSIRWSPNKKHFIATWSRPDHAPVTELRHALDGSLVCVLERADASALLASGWRMPERFVAKGRDGVTDIHGILIRPSHFDPKRSYPVVEQVYAGPHSAFAPKEFEVLPRQHALAELGFILVQADGMGTNHRGKAFHDVCWKNLKDAGFPDRIGWIRSAAQTRPWMDLSRVGIYGGSAGGQSAMRALLDHADFYKVAVADCGCHDNRMDKIWWNEQWLGWPLDDSYVRNSNVEDASKLQGRLLLLVGELDENVDPASTYQVVHALQRAGKSFDFMTIMGTGHSAAETPFGTRMRMEFLARHLNP